MDARGFDFFLYNYSSFHILSHMFYHILGSGLLFVSICYAVGHISPGRFNPSQGYEPPLRTTYPPVVEFIRRHAFTAFIFVVFLGTAILLGVEYEKMMRNGSGHEDFIRLAKLLSVPLVCLLFTWFHVWLALQMMFFPIEFVGLPSRPIVPSWFGLPINGWQGIVPRKAEVMARRACDRMIGNIVTIEDQCRHAVAMPS